MVRLPVPVWTRWRENSKRDHKKCLFLLLSHLNCIYSLRKFFYLACFTVHSFLNKSWMKVSFKTGCGSVTHLDTSRIGTGATSPNSTWNVLAEVGQMSHLAPLSWLAAWIYVNHSLFSFPCIHLSHTICQQCFVPSAHHSICSPRSCQLAYLQSLRFYRSPSSFSQTSWIVRILYFPNLPYHLLLTWRFLLVRCHLEKAWKQAF